MELIESLRRVVVPFVGAAVVVIAPATVASAHTETDFVAVPAGSTATVTFKPEHGCGESPTVKVRVQAPVADAVAADVDGWTATATPDGAGNTVLEWTGGSTPAHEAGAFPAEFTVPDAVGTLLRFPAVQTCENGEELAWIGTDPGDDLPAPAVLVLAAGAEPAATIDAVAADAPGRVDLAALLSGEPVHEETPATVAVTEVPTTVPVATTTVAPTTLTPTTVAPTASTAAATPTSAAAPSTSVAANADDGGSKAPALAIGAGAVVLIGGTAFALNRRRSGGSTG